MWASIDGHADTVRFLLETEGINVNAASNDGMTALLFACRYGRDEVARSLLGHGGIDMSAVEADTGHTALMLACIHEHVDTVRLLMQHGADHRLLCHEGLTARDYAAGLPLLQSLLPP